jgi:hypothetical protein
MGNAEREELADMVITAARDQLLAAGLDLREIAAEFYDYAELLAASAAGEACSADGATR